MNRHYQTNTFISSKRFIIELKNFYHKRKVNVIELRESFELKKIHKKIDL